MKKTLIETAGTMTHRATCTLCKASRCSMPTACLHVAGTPCVDWSSMPGSSHSKECGNSALPFYAWAALRYLVQYLVIVHENVPSFDPSLLEYLLGSVYVSAASSSISCNLAFLVGENGGLQFSYTGNMSQTQSLLGQIILLHAAIGSPLRLSSSLSDLSCLLDTPSGRFCQIVPHMSTHFTLTHRA